MSAVHNYCWYDLVSRILSGRLINMGKLEVVMRLRYGTVLHQRSHLATTIQIPEHGLIIHSRATRWIAVRWLDLPPTPL